MAYAAPENLTSLTDMFVYVDGVTGGIYGSGILICLYIIIVSYLKMRGNETSSCFVAAGFITSISALMMFLMELIGNWELFIAVMSLAIPLVWGYLGKD